MLNFVITEKKIIYKSAFMKKNGKKITLNVWNFDILNGHITLITSHITMGEWFSYVASMGDWFNFVASMGEWLNFVASLGEWLRLVESAVILSP